MVETDRQSRELMRRDLAHREQHTRHERAAVETVGADDELLAGVAEQHLLMRVEATQAHGVHMDAVDDLATRAAIGLRLVRDGTQTRLIYTIF